jgi:uncharacterized protein YqeY
MINIDELILQAMKNKHSNPNGAYEVKAYRAIKSEIQAYKTAKNAKPYDESAEIQLLNKMVKQREESIRQYSEAGREDLVNSEVAELEFIKQLLPVPVTIEDMKDWLLDYLTDKNYLEGDGNTLFPYVPKKEMGNIIKAGKLALPGVDGKLLSELVKEYIKP